MKQVLTLALVFFSSYFTYAQDTIVLHKQNELKYGIGAGAGFATGYGLSFKYLPKKWGAQINFAPFKNTTVERYSAGITFLYTIKDNKSTNLFVYQANHYYYSTYTQNNPLNGEKIVYETTQYINNGLGFGIEAILAKRIGLNLMAGYAFYKNFTQVNVTGETALYYKF